jgi:hypothetical protein
VQIRAKIHIPTRYGGCYWLKDLITCWDLANLFDLWN